MGTMRIGGGHRTLRFLSLAVLLGATGLCHADILNPSFEQSYTQGTLQLPLHWNCNDHYAFGYYVSDSWSSDGTLSANIYSRISQIVQVGDYESLYQSVDLTQVDAIIFDAALSARGGVPDPVYEGFEAAFLVDGVVLWSETADGMYLDQQVDVSDLSGMHTIELRNTALVDGSCTVSSWTQWDNLRVIEAPEVIEATVEIKPDVLRRPSLRKWITCYIELPEGYSAGDIDGQTIALELAEASTDTVSWQGWANPVFIASSTTDHDDDGLAERMVRFGRFTIWELLSLQKEEITVTVKGELTDGTAFQGSDEVSVVNPWNQWTNGHAGCRGRGIGNAKAMLEKVGARVRRLPHSGARGR